MLKDANRRDVVFDISRLVTRFSRPAPNGIDRVDLGYAQHFFGANRQGRGLLLGPLGPRAVDNVAARRVVEAVSHHWRESGQADDDAAFTAVKVALRGADRSALSNGTAAARRRTIAMSVCRLFEGGHAFRRGGLLRGAGPACSVPEGAAYLNVSQFPLWWTGYFRWLRARPDIKPVFFLHDLLPLEHPDFFPPAEMDRHAARLEVTARYAAGVIVASEGTKVALAAHLRRNGRRAPPTCVLPLPVTPHFLEHDTVEPALRDHVYFVVVGTIEPRKNHLLLLQVWRELAHKLGQNTPKLVVVGTRGWDNENVVDMLERCASVRRFVVEVDRLSTPALRRLLAGARALLVPSIAEGYGLPVAEALAAGVRVVASDIPSFRAIGGSALTLLDPLDGPGWMNTIRRLASHARAPRQAYVPACVAASSWACHMEHTEQFVASL